ncbi:MAG: NADH-quinone oxidoreductase subunit I [Nitrospirae bacterium]|nr:NADH-quinone oxidoreductase subunit I [Nitrospirota bacterium]
MSELLKHGKSLFNSLYISLRHCFNKAVTVQYPYQKPETPPAFRGAIALGKDESGKDICIACDACVKVCPSSCIIIESHKGEGKKRELDVFDVDMTKCCFCGFCEEICPTEPVAIKLTRLFEYSTNNRKQIDTKRDALYDIYDGHFDIEREGGKVTHVGDITGIKSAKEIKAAKDLKETKETHVGSST